VVVVLQLAQRVAELSFLTGFSVCLFVGVTESADGVSVKPGKKIYFLASKKKPKKKKNQKRHVYSTCVSDNRRSNSSISSGSGSGGGGDGIIRYLIWTSSLRNIFCSSCASIIVMNRTLVTVITAVVTIIHG
jgi:hypothetical protein